jgi:RNA polymerase sigma factor (sigma-70 family)
LIITEAEIVEGCKAGKRELQKALYTRFSGKMYAVCLRYSKSREEAEDILQDGFIKVFHSIQQFMGAGSFEGWIRRIIVNTALEALRKKKLDFSSFDIEQAENHNAQSFDMTSQVSANDLLTIIQELPTGYRTIFNLYAIEGYQHKEIAVMLGISEGTSKSQLARARNMLQERLKKSEVFANPKELKQ